MKKHIIFDFDDTVSSAYEHNQQLFVDTFLPYKPDIDQDFVRKVHFSKRGTSMDVQFREVVNKFGLKVSVDKLVRENELLHQKRANNIKIFDGFEELLKHFKKLGKVVSICTNRETGSLNKILKRNNMAKYFDNVISCKDRGHEKPDPFLLLELIDKYPNIRREEVIYFGDSKTDAEFAQNANVDYLIIDHYLNKKQFYTMVLGSFAGIEDELLVEVDENDKEVGVVYKMDAHTNSSRYHRAASILVFNRRGDIILQKRSSLKAVDPGKWDLTGGHQTYGQTIDQTAGLELMEELGIKSKLLYIRKGLKQDENQSEFYYLYYTINDGPYKLDMHEVDEVKAFKCEKLIKHGYDKEYVFLNYVYERVEELRAVWEKLSKKKK